MCARHEIVAPNGLGELQKGERFVLLIDVLIYLV